MRKVITEETEVISHLTPLVGREDALNMVNNFKKEIIEGFAEKLKEKVNHDDTDYYTWEDVGDLIDNAVWDEVK